MVKIWGAYRLQQFCLSTHTITISNKDGFQQRRILYFFVFKATISRYKRARIESLLWHSLHDTTDIWSECTRTPAYNQMIGRCSMSNALNVCHFLTWHKFLFVVRPLLFWHERTLLSLRLIRSVPFDLSFSDACKSRHLAAKCPSRVRARSYGLYSNTTSIM